MISIVVPVYNASQYIGDCIDSVMSQDYSDWQLILVDDGSTDDSAEIIKKYLSDSRLKYIRKYNSGVTETRWLGVEESSGDLIMFLDADDMLSTDALTIIMTCFDDNLDILAFDMQSFVNSTEVTTAGQNFISLDVTQESTKQLDLILSGKLLSCVWGGVYRKSAISDTKDIFCNRLRIAEDTMFNVELATRKNLNVRKISAKLYAYRQNPKSVTRAVNSNRFDAIWDALEYISEYEGRNPELCRSIRGAIAFRKLLLWSTFMFHPENEYYHNKSMRRDMKKLYPIAFSRLYAYLKVYLFIDLFLGSWISQKII